ncbi:MAG TPA: LLM class flavin-dependent oxidoreductase [Methylomirabilota bacterium]
MRFGTYFFLQAPPGHRHADIIQRELQQMVWSEQLGFDEVWLTEHHFIDYGLSVDPATLASAVASRTSRVRIGLAAAILPFHDPIRLAEQLALVDIISGGRLDVGVGRGNRPSEFTGYRIPQVESRERFDEAVQIIQRAWTEERFAYHGRFFQIPEVRVIPKPLQRPHPPLYQVCVSPDSIETTALRGWPMLNSILFGGLEQVVASRDRYVTTLQKAGRSPAEIASLLDHWGVSRQIYVAPTDAQASPRPRTPRCGTRSRSASSSFPSGSRTAIPRCSRRSGPWRSGSRRSPGRGSWPRHWPSARRRRWPATSSRCARSASVRCSAG